MQARMQLDTCQVTGLYTSLLSAATPHLCLQVAMTLQMVRLAAAH